MTYDTKLIAWAAGIFEGEGCFSLTVNTAKRQRAAVARIVMTDHDIIVRFRDAVQMGRVRGPIQVKTNKPYWAWSVSSFEETQQLICLLWEHLGARRRAKAKELLTGYCAFPTVQFQRPKRRPASQLTAQQAADIRHRAAMGCANADTAFNYGVSPSLVSLIVSGKRHVGGAL